MPPWAAIGKELSLILFEDSRSSICSTPSISKASVSKGISLASTTLSCSCEVVLPSCAQIEIFKKATKTKLKGQN